MSRDPMSRQMTAWEAHHYAREVVLPRLLALPGLVGDLEPIERNGNPLAEVLDYVGGVDFWVKTPDRRLLAIASRVQWWHEDGVNRRSFTIRLGDNREAGKRIRALAEGGIVPDWTVQGYMDRDGRFICGGIITTRELFRAFAAASCDPRFTTRVNHYDGTPFWPGFWRTLRRYGNATTLHTIEGGASDAGPAH